MTLERYRGARLNRALQAMLCLHAGTSDYVLKCSGIALKSLSGERHDLT